MRLIPALSAFPSIAEAVVASQPITTSMGIIPSLRLFCPDEHSRLTWQHKMTLEHFEGLMKEAFKYSGPIKMYYLNGEWHGR